ncbi:MAG: nucleotidyltransferase domain-containing protein [Campylobacterota bacterium]|nr:nucleotidyltransferase domain-containing protein [Campylobacterota bacterium]
MFNKSEILEYLASIKTALQHEGIAQIGLFGSFARNEGDLGSDIDIVIETSPEFVKAHPAYEALAYLEALREKISNRFGGFRVDICDRSGLDDALKEKILKDACYV